MSKQNEVHEYGMQQAYQIDVSTSRNRNYCADLQVRCRIGKNINPVPDEGVISLTLGCIDLLLVWQLECKCVLVLLGPNTKNATSHLGPNRLWGKIQPNQQHCSQHLCVAYARESLVKGALLF